MTPFTDINFIHRALPHRFPFLLIDRVVEVVANDYIVAIKNISVNEPQFSGHFPNYPVMPGVLLVESLAQACGILMFMSYDMKKILPKNKYCLLTGIDDCRFRQMVTPGDQVFLHAKLTRQKKSLFRFSTHATVNEKTVCCATLTSTF